MRKEQTAALVEPNVHGHIILLTGLKHLRWCGWHLRSSYFLVRLGHTGKLQGSR